MKRKPRKKRAPSYPGLKEAGMDRRKFLGLLTRSIIGVSVLGATACDGDKQDVGGDTADDVKPDEWVTMGVAPPDLHEEDTYEPDIVEEDWQLGGVARRPEEIQTADNQDIQEDQEEDYVLGGFAGPPRED